MVNSIEGVGSLLNAWLINHSPKIAEPRARAHTRNKSADCRRLRDNGDNDRFNCPVSIDSSISRAVALILSTDHNPRRDAWRRAARFARRHTNRIDRRTSTVLCRPRRSCGRAHARTSRHCVMLCVHSVCACRTRCGPAVAQSQC